MQSYILTTPLTTNYTVSRAYTSTDTGFVQRPYSLTANTGSAGVYLLHFTMCFAADNNTTNFKVEGNRITSAGVNTDLENTACEQFIHTSGELATVSGGGLLTIADGDSIYITIANLTDATDCVIRHSNLTVKRA